MSAVKCPLLPVSCLKEAVTFDDSCFRYHNQMSISTASVVGRVLQGLVAELPEVHGYDHPNNGIDCQDWDDIAAVTGEGWHGK